MIKNILKDSTLYGMSGLLFKLTNFLTLPLYTRLFTLSDYGIMALLLASAEFAALLCCLGGGLNHALIAFYAGKEKRERSKGLFALFFLLSLFFLLFFALFFPLFPLLSDSLFGRHKLSLSLLTTAFLGAYLGQCVQLGIDALRLRFAKGSILLLLALQQSITLLTTLASVCLFQSGIRGVFLGIAAGHLAALPPLFWNLRKELAGTLERGLLLSIFSYASPFLLTAAAHWILTSMDRWMLAELSSMEEAGLYSVSCRFGTPLLFCIQAFGRGWSPHALKAYGSNSDYKRLFSRVGTIWLYFLIFIASAAGIFSKELLQWQTPKEYWGASESFGILALGLAFYGSTSASAMVISLKKKSGHFGIASWLAVCVNFLLNLWLIPACGAKGAAWATLFAYLALTLYYLVCTQRLDPLPLEKSRLLAIFIVLLASLLFQQKTASLPVSPASFCLKLLFVAALAAPGALFLRKKRPEWTAA